MSTRSNIYLKLKDESKGQTIKFDFSKLPTKNGEHHDPLEFPIKDVKIPKNAKYMRIYHHWDGYLSGVGKTLLKTYKDYETILNLLVMGDISTINDGVQSYQGWRNEDTPPQFINNSGKIKTSVWSKRKKDWVEKYVKVCDESGELQPKEALCEEYAYLFDGEKWYTCYSEYDEKTDEYYVTDWVELTEELINKND